MRNLHAIKCVHKTDASLGWHNIVSEQISKYYAYQNFNIIVLNTLGVVAL